MEECTLLKQNELFLSSPSLDNHLLQKYMVSKSELQIITNRRRFQCISKPFGNNYKAILHVNIGRSSSEAVEKV